VCRYPAGLQGVSCALSKEYSATVAAFETAKEEPWHRRFYGGTVASVVTQSTRMCELSEKVTAALFFATSETKGRRKVIRKKVQTASTAQIKTRQLISLEVQSNDLDGSHLPINGFHVAQADHADKSPLAAGLGRC